MIQTIKMGATIVIAVSCVYIALKFNEPEKQGVLVNIKKAQPIMPIKSPKYPEKSLEIGEEGVTILEITIDKIGKPKSVKIQKSSGSKYLDKAAIEATENSLFIPKVINGRIEETNIGMPFKFKID